MRRLPGSRQSHCGSILRNGNPFLPGHMKSHDHGSRVIRFGAKLDRSTLRLHDPLGDRQTKAAAFDLSLRIFPAHETPEEAALV